MYFYANTSVYKGTAELYCKCLCNYFLTPSHDVCNNIVHFYVSAMCLASIMNAVMFSVLFLTLLFALQLKKKNQISLRNVDPHKETSQVY